MAVKNLYINVKKNVQKVNILYKKIDYVIKK